MEMLRNIYRRFMKAFAILLNLFDPNRSSMEGVFHGSPYFWTNFLKTIIRPHHYIIRQRYGQAIRIFPVQNIAKPINNQFNFVFDNDDFKACLKTFKKDGIVKLPFQFDEEVIEISKNYRLAETDFDLQDGYYDRGIEPFEDQIAFKMLTNKFFLNLVAAILGCQPKLRHRTVFRIDRSNISLPTEENAQSDAEFSKAANSFASNWHIDNPNLIHVDIHFSNVTLETTHMELA